MGQRDLDHISVPFNPTTEPFQNPQGSGEKTRHIPQSRLNHATGLKEQYTVALASNPTEDNGTYITFFSIPEYSLELEQLDSKKNDKSSIHLCNVVNLPDGRQKATVYIPDNKKELFFKKITEYTESIGIKENPKHSKLIDHIQEIRRATIRELWTDSPDELPPNPTEPVWWEVWLRKRDGMELGRFQRFANKNSLQLKESFLGFGNRIVLLVKASVDQLTLATQSLDDLAELRRPHEVATTFTTLNITDQQGLIDGLIKRIKAPDITAPTVCVLDTGITHTHPLLKLAIDESDCHGVDPSWSKYPISPHGTEMAGLALYSNLQECLSGSAPVELFHRLESVKILPDNGSNEPELYGQVTAQAVIQPEIQSATRERTYMLAVTAAGSGENAIDPGQPTSWSAAVDALAYGRDIRVAEMQLTVLDNEAARHQRLFIISGGNIQPESLDSPESYLDRCDLSSIEDPAQAWNAITVGAYSSQDTMEGAPKGFDGYVPVAPKGEISPVSRTSVIWNHKHWPFKPDVVADGGNVAHSSINRMVDTPENLALVTTRMYQPGSGLLTTTRDTSAATAQVAAIAADVMAAYPNLNMETIRALVVHSAEWTKPMESRFINETGKRDRSALLRRYGMGVPDRTRAIKSAANALNLLVEGKIRPFKKQGSNNISGDMHLYELPWPKEELLALEVDTRVRMRVTLSYFIDPNPSRRGWTGRYRYASYGLRFASILPTETKDQFKKRINKLAREEGEARDSTKDQGWFFGPEQQRKPGSLHTDIWEGAAADLASKALIAVYPITGWWKGFQKGNLMKYEADYSLVVSIESPDVEVDLYTPIKQQVEAAIEAEIPF